MLGERHGAREGRKHVDHVEMSRMHRTQREFRSDRWTPAWALDDKKVRLVVYQYVWSYVFSITKGAIPPGTSLAELEKIARIQGRRHWAERVDKISSEAQRYTIKEHLRTTEKGIAARIVSVIYKAYRERLTAADISELMEISHINVRQLLCRTNKIARKLFPEQACFKPHWTAKLKPECAQKERRPGGRPRVRVHREPRPRFTPISEQTKILAEKYSSGVLLAELSKESGIPLSTVAWRLKASGLVKTDRTNPSFFPPKLVLTPELLELAYWRKAAGVSFPELAIVAGIRPETLRGRFLKFGLL